MNSNNAEIKDTSVADALTERQGMERESFEAWAHREGYSVAKVLGGVGDDGQCVYDDACTHAGWLAWQAAATAKSPKYILRDQIEYLQEENSQLIKRVRYLDEQLATAQNIAGIAEYQVRVIREVLTITGTRPSD